MDWHVPLLVITAAFAALAALALVRVRGAQRVVEHRVAIVGAREAAFIGILQRLSAARKLEDILLETAHAIERIIPDCIGTIQLIENGKIRNGAAPGLPKFYNDVVEGLAIGEGVGSCGSAAALRKPVIVEDVFDHPYWAPYADIARAAGFAACWSHPVIQADGTVIATFATYYRTKRAPSEDELSTIRAFAEILRLAIEQFRNRVALMDAKNAAQDASRAKSRFLSMMSHELRTPLNAIIGFSDVLRLELYGPRDLPIYQDYADNIHRSGRHLLELVNQILDVSRVEAGKLDLKMENLPLPTALTDVLQIEGGAILKKALQVHVADGQDLSVRADGQSLRQLLLNVVDNAIKYSPAGGTIEIGATQTKGRVTVSVVDEGPGVPPDKLDQLGLPFVSFADPEMVDSKQSIGLGLSISRALAEAMDGEIRFDNRPD
ncbi:MAG TPA: GAF domain-containing sensor histidine kinase, partial [Dongiaceae bacterium]|nr:GAF domain-containing sensor histidine kinase [Dongiaceae bacterium]